MPKPPRKQSITPLIIALIGIGLLIVAGILLVMNQSPAEIASSPQGETAPVEAIYPDIERVSLEDAKTAFDDQTAVFVDVRSLAAYQAAHIPGAVSLPLNDIPDRIADLSPDDWIITYCT